MKSRRDEELAVYVVSETDELFDEEDEQEVVGRKKHGKRDTPTRGGDGSQFDLEQRATPPAQDDALKRTRSLNFFAAARPRSQERARDKSRVAKTLSEDERKSLTRKSAQLLGLDLEGNVVKSAGRKRFSLHRRSMSYNTLF